MNLNGADGISDMAGYAARVAVEPSGNERDTNFALAFKALLNNLAK